MPRGRGEACRRDRTFPTEPGPAPGRNRTTSHTASDGTGRSDKKRVAMNGQSPWCSGRRRLRAVRGGPAGDLRGRALVAGLRPDRTRGTRRAGGRPLRRAQERARRWLRLRQGSADAHYVIARAALALDQADVFRQSSRRALASGLGQPRAPLRGLVDAGQGRYQGTETALLAAIAAGDGPDPQIDEALVGSTLGRCSVEPGRSWTDGPSRHRPTPGRTSGVRKFDRRVRRGTECSRPITGKPWSGLLDARGPSGPARRPPRPATSRRGACRNMPPTSISGPITPPVISGQVPGCHALDLDDRDTGTLSLRAELAARRGDLPSALDDLDRAVALRDELRFATTTPCSSVPRPWRGRGEGAGPRRSTPGRPRSIEPAQGGTAPIARRRRSQGGDGPMDARPRPRRGRTRLAEEIVQPAPRPSDRQSNLADLPHPPGQGSPGEFYRSQCAAGSAIAARPCASIRELDGPAHFSQAVQYSATFDA